MAAEALTVLATQTIEKIAREGLRAFNAAYWVGRDVETLQDRLTSIAALFKDADCCIEIGEQNLEWLKRLRDASFDAEDVLDTYATEVLLIKMKNFPAPVDWLRSRLYAAYYIKRILAKFDSIYETKKQLKLKPKNSGGKIEGPPSGDAMSSNQSGIIDRNKLLGREAEKTEIKNWLGQNGSNEQVQCFVIHGMGGLGKTALAREVCGEMASSFQKYAWVDVSVVFNSGTILNKIAQGLEIKKPNGLQWETPYEKIKKVLNEKPFLLVLDNVWVNRQLQGWDDFWEVLVKLLPNGSKVLITTRDDRMVSRSGAQDSMFLKNLSEADCLELFKRHLSFTPSEESKSEWEKIFEEFIKKCNYLPLAVKAMATAVKPEKGLDYWQRQVENPIWGIDENREDEGGRKIQPALIMSFQNLPPLAKLCFSFCALYPKGHIFDKLQLVKLWIAEGYIHPPPTGMIDTLEQLGSECFDKLHCQTFFQAENEKENKFTMHDLMHDLATEVSIGMLQYDDNTKHVNADISHRHVSYSCKSDGNTEQESTNEFNINQLLKAKNLRTLIQPVSGTIDFSRHLKKIFKTLRYIRVIDLSSSCLIDLPKSIKYLKLLHYLDLSRTKVRSLPRSITKLLNLQILKLLGCTEFKELPNDLGNLKELRHLELDEEFWFNCSRSPPRIGRLTNLQNLHCFHVHRKSGYGIEELKSMKCLGGLLHILNLENALNSEVANLKEKRYITNLILEWSEENASPQDQSMQEEVLEGLQPCKYLEELTIKHYKGSKLSNWMGVRMIERFKNLHKVSLKHCVNCRTLTLGPLPHLRHLIIKGMLELEEWPENNSFLSLNRLTISHCPQLRNLPPSNFLSLRALKINQCYALKALPVMPFLNFLKLFNNDMLEDMNEVLLEVNVDANLERNCINTMQYLGISNAMRPEDIEIVKFKINAKEFDGIENGGPYFVRSFLQLLDLEMVNCPRVQALPKSFAPQKLKISECPSLTTLPDQRRSQRFHFLEVDKCNSPSLIETIQRSAALEKLTISNIKNMTTIPMLPDYPKLGTLYIHHCEELMSLSHEEGFLANCTSLKFLSISECHNLMTFEEEGLPASLEWLTIKKCSKLSSIHGRSNDYLSKLTSLKELHLEDCPNLASLPEDTLPVSLQHLWIKGCPLLEQHCNKDTVGKWWEMISNTIHLDVEVVNTNSPQPQPSCSFF